MLIKEWRVIYSQSFDNAENPLNWSSSIQPTEEAGYARYESYKKEHFDKKKMSALMLLLVEWDAQTGHSSMTTLKHLQHKMMQTIHYNKQEGVASPKYAFVNPVMAEAPSAPAPEFTNALLVMAYQQHFQ